VQRREMLLSMGAAVLGISAFPRGWAVAEEKKRPKILYFTKSAGYMHSVVKRKGGKLAFSERIFTKLGKKNGFEVVCSQDATAFDGDLGQYDLIAFYTSGRKRNTKNKELLDDKQKQRLLDAVAAGKPFVGIHSATDSFRKDDDRIDPYTAMIGAEFNGHGAQQKALMKVVSPKFPGMKGLGKGFKLLDEWYTFCKFSKDLHVVLLQETTGMKGPKYQCPPFPATWAKMYGKGRVFYTSMGHREDVWTGKIFQQVLLGGLSWGLDRADADVTPNLDRVVPKAKG
jgi:type 1 glutamine amidotransferase